jgi:hypothetical protein
MTATAEKKRQHALDGFTAALALSVFVGAILVATVLVLGTAYLVITQPWSPWTWTLAVLTVSMPATLASSSSNITNTNSSSSAHGLASLEAAACFNHFPKPTLQATLAFVPLWEKNGPLGEEFMRYICSHAEAYFPITVVCDGGATFSKDKSYVVGEY